MADLSPADELCAAAKLIRERAEAAAAHSPGPWTPVTEPADHLHRIATADVPEWIIARSLSSASAHIAGMHPGVALAVADLLEAASTCECEEGDDHADIKQAALAIARAYLAGESP